MKNNKKLRKIGDTKETNLTSISLQTFFFLGKLQNSTLMFIEGSERSRDHM